MLMPAKEYEDQLNGCMSKTVMDLHYKWYHLQYPDPIIKVDDTFWNKIQLVSVYEGVVQGYFKADWKRPENYINSISCINFDHSRNKNISINKNTFAIDVRNFLKYLAYDINVPKVEWNVTMGNPVEKHYNRFVKLFSGRIVGIERYAHFINGKYYDNKMYEWINDYFECAHCGNREKNEREVMCWKCGLGEMVYRNPFNKGKY